MDLSNLFSGYRWSAWVMGMMSAFLGGGAAAVSGAVGVSIFLDQSYLHSLGAFLELVIAIFLPAAILGFFAYIKEHSKPDAVEETVHTRMVQEPSGRTTIESEKTTSTPVSGAEPKVEIETKTKEI